MENASNGHDILYHELGQHKAFDDLTACAETKKSNGGIGKQRLCLQLGQMGSPSALALVAAEMGNGEGKVMRLWNLWLAAIIIFWIFVSCLVTKTLPLSPKPRMRLFMIKK